MEELTKVCDDKTEEFKQLELEDTKKRELLKHAHSQAKKLEKSLAQEQKKVVLPFSALLCMHESIDGIAFQFAIRIDALILFHVN